MPELQRFGEVLEHQSPKVRMKIDRTQVPAVLSALLGRYTIEDISVEDPPLEDVIAGMFAQIENDAG